MGRIVNFKEGNSDKISELPSLMNRKLVVKLLGRYYLEFSY
jgi:hypothetical protein